MYDTNNNVRAVLTGGNSGGTNWAVAVNDFVFSTVLRWMQEDGEFVSVGMAGPAVMELAADSTSGAAAGGGP